MVAAEFKSAISTVRIHDEYCEPAAEQRISQLGHIISASYRRRQLSGRPEDGPAKIAAANITSNTVKS